MFLIKTISNQKGQGLAASIVGAGLVGILALAFFSINKMQTQFKTKVDLTNTVQALRYEFYSTIKNSKAWSYTRSHIDNTTAFDCINVGGVSSLCCGWDPTTQTYDPGATICTELKGPITLVDQFGVVLSKRKVDAGTPNDGFTLNGEKCNSFDYVNGNDACPIRFEVSVDSKCKAGINCTSPQIKLNARLVYKPDPNNTRLANLSLLGADDSAATTSDFDFTVLRNSGNEASASQAKLFKMQHDPCDPADPTQIYPNHCSAPNRDSSSVEFWKVPGGVKKFVVEIWGAGGGGAGGRFYEKTDLENRRMYQYLWDFYSGGVAGLSFSNDNAIGIDANTQLPVRHFFAGGGGAGGGFATAVFAVDSAGPRYYKIVVGNGGAGGDHDSPGAGGRLSLIEGPYECIMAVPADCDLDVNRRIAANFNLVGDQFLVAFGGKPGFECDNNWDCRRRDRSGNTNLGMGGGPAIGNPANGNHQIGDLDVIPSGAWPPPSSYYVARGGMGDVDPANGFVPDDAASGVTNVFPGSAGGDMDQIHTSFYHPGEMKRIGDNAVHRLEFEFYPDDNDDGGQVAFELEYLGVVYSQEGLTGSGGQAKFLGKELVSGINIDDHRFEDYINDLKDPSRTNYMINTTNWHFEDGQHIDTSEDNSAVMPGFQGGFQVTYKNDLGVFPMKLLKVKGEAGVDCSADNGGLPCLEFAGNTGQNQLSVNSPGAKTEGQFVMTVLPDNLFPQPVGAGGEGGDIDDDFHGVDGTVLKFYDPINGEWDCLYMDALADGVNRRLQPLQVPNAANSGCDGDVVLVTDSDIDPDGGVWRESGDYNDVEDVILDALNDPPFDAYLDDDDDMSAAILFDYHNNGAVPCPQVKVPDGAGSYVDPGPGVLATNFVISGNCTVGSPGGWIYPKIRSFVVTNGGLWNAQYHNTNNYFTKYYFGGRGGRAARGGSGGVNDFDNLGTPPSSPGGGGAGKMLNGCLSELFYDNDGDSILENDDLTDYNCTVGGAHDYDVNGAMRGAPGAVLIYY